MQYNFDAVPQELKARPAWLMWRREEREPGKPTKVPYTAWDTAGSSTNPRTWCKFERAVSAYKRGGFDGIGIALTPASGYVGIDLDHCITAEGVMLPWAQEIIECLNSYTEISPSGQGVRIFCRGILPPKDRKKGNVEMYDGGRWLTITGRHIASTPRTIEERSEQIAAMHEKYLARPEMLASGPGQSYLTDQQVLERALKASNGAKFGRLYSGDAGDYHSRSEAHLALCGALAFWCGGDVTQIDRLFRQSGMYSEPGQAERWNERHSGDGRTYGEMTIARACNRNDFFKPWEPINRAPGGSRRRPSAA